ncbi:MAG: hypothetical protein ABSA58_24660 [Acetobacteraceae bacterium]|jgi:protein-S-isoprenylcysteine O-methyltransferase Ste14
MNQPRARIKPGRASLIGGIAVTVASFILWLGVTHEMGVDTEAVLALGVCVAAGIGIWIRLADL